MTSERPFKFVCEFHKSQTDGRIDLYEHIHITVFPGITPSSRSKQSQAPDRISPFQFEMLFAKGVQDLLSIRHDLLL